MCQTKGTYTCIVKVKYNDNIFKTDKVIIQCKELCQKNVIQVKMYYKTNILLKQQNECGVLAK